MLARFMQLEDGNEVICLAKAKFSDIVVLEPSDVWYNGTYGVVMCRRDGKSDLIAPFVKGLDLGVRSIGAPLKDGVAIDLSDMPEEFCDSSTLLSIVSARYGDGFKQDVSTKLLRVYNQLANSQEAVGLETAYKASPWLMDDFLAIMLSCESLPSGIKAGFQTGSHPANHWVNDEVVAELLTYCEFFEHAELLKLLITDYFSK